MSSSQNPKSDPTDFAPGIPELVPKNLFEELPLSFLTCDCSSEGNSFCVIFRPAAQPRGPSEPSGRVLWDLDLNERGSFWCSLNTTKKRVPSKEDTSKWM